MIREELAFKAGVSYPMIVAIEKSNRIPGLKIASKLAGVLGIKVDDLINGSEKEGGNE